MIRRCTLAPTLDTSRRSMNSSKDVRFAGNTGDRSGYRPAPTPLNPSNPAAPNRSMSGSAGYSGYYQEQGSGNFPAGAMPQSTMGYHQSPTDYTQTDTRQAQGFTAGTYNPMMYNVQQAAGAQSTGVYDASSQFSRQPAALHMLPTDVAAPYFQSEPTNAAVPAASAIQQPTASSSTPQGVYQQQGLPSYSSGSMTGMGGPMAATSQPSATTADVSMDEEYPSAGGLDEAYHIVPDCSEGDLPKHPKRCFSRSQRLASQRFRLATVSTSPS